MLSKTGKHTLALEALGAPKLTVPVETSSEASQAFQAYRNQYCFGASSLRGKCGQIFDPNGKPVAYVSYNGRVWEGKIGSAGEHKLIEEATPLPMGI